MIHEEFVEKSRDRHGDRYDYSLVGDPKSKEKVNIVCKLHGQFRQNASAHIMGRNCPECGRESHKHKMLMTTENFIDSCKEVHKDYYDYSRVNYVGSLDKIEVICPKHGSFTQVASTHKNGSGCRKCFGEKNSEAKRSNNEDFEARARAVWGDKYDYSEVDYKHCETRVTIICPEHGEFHRTPNHHLVKFGGCSLCHKTAKSKEYLDKFITKAKLIHGDKYSYDDTQYEASKVRVVVTCPKHGQFKIFVSSHLRGQGCQKCSKENPNQGIYMFAGWGDEYIEKHMEEYGHLPSTCYLLSFILDGSHCYKVGITTRSTEERIVDLKKKSRREGFPLTELVVVEESHLTHKESYEMEQKVLTKLREIGEKVEVKLKGHTETFYIPPSDAISQLFLSHLPANYTPPDSPTKAS